MARIAIGGWQHETNTFSTIKADYQAFERADEWPPLSRGADMLHQVNGVHLPITGAWQHLKGRHHEMVPLLWCSATPCAQVTKDAYERIATMLLDSIRQALPLDGLYLDLHGAMVCEHLEDGEGELLRRIRQVVGQDLPVSVSLDLHANITPEMVQHADLMEVFRTYPHVDMGETGARAASRLEQMIVEGRKFHVAYRQIGFLIALNWGCTDTEPCRSIYGRIPELITEDVVSASFASGFHLSDIHHVGPSVISYARTARAASRVADELATYVASWEHRFDEKIWPAAAGVTEALRLRCEGAGTIVLADTQDNPGEAVLAIQPDCCKHWWKAVPPVRYSGCFATRRRSPQPGSPAWAVKSRCPWVDGRDCPDRSRMRVTVGCWLWPMDTSPPPAPCMMGLIWSLALVPCWKLMVSRSQFHPPRYRLRINPCFGIWGLSHPLCRFSP